jgi:hypothetical protein
MKLDLLFTVQRGQKAHRGHKHKAASKVILQLSVNDTTLCLAPDGPVKELGNPADSRLYVIGTSGGTYTLCKN